MLKKEISSWILGLCLSCSAPLIAEAKDATISVQGHGVVHAVPDTAHISFNISMVSKDVSTAKNFVDESSKEIHEFITTKGLDSKNISAENWNIHPHHDYDDKLRKQVFKGYKVSRQFSLHFPTDLEFSSILDGLTQRKIESLNNVSFTNSNSDELEDKALKVAIERAKHKAKLIAKSFTRELGSAISIQESGMSPSPRPMQARTLMKQESSSIFEPGEVGVYKSVSVVFELK